MKLKNIYLALVLLLGVSLTSFGQTTPQLPEMPDLTIYTNDLANNDCSPIVEDYLEEYRDDYLHTYQARIKQTPQPATSFSLGENDVLIELQKWQGGWSGSWVTIDQQEFIVDVKDDTDPTVSATNFISNLNVDAGECFATMPNLSGITAGDFFNDNSTLCLGNLHFVSQNPTTGSSLSIGENTISITVRDDSNNQATATTTIMVIDNEGPVMSRIPDLRIRNYDNQCYAKMPDVSNHVKTNFVSDCSGQGVITQNIPVGTHINLGDHTVEVTMADGVGNTTSSSFVINVFDNTNPIISLKPYDPFTLNPNSVNVHWRQIVNASDNCDEDLEGSIAKENETASDYVTFDCCELGENIVTVTVWDNNENETTITATVLI